MMENEMMWKCWENDGEMMEHDVNMMKKMMICSTGENDVKNDEKHA